MGPSLDSVWKAPGFGPDAHCPESAHSLIHLMLI